MPASTSTGIKIAVFAICSIMAALGGLMLASRLSSVDTNAGGGSMLLYSIAAAVIGGTSLFGGRGTVKSAILGAIVIAMIDNGLGLLNVSAGTKYIVTGARAAGRGHARLALAPRKGRDRPSLRRGLGRPLRPLRRCSASRVTASSTSAALTTAGNRLAGILGHAHRQLRLAGLVQRLGDLGADLLGAHRVELDRRHREPAVAERDRARAGLPELDPRLLERDQVAQRVGHVAEAVLELLAQQHQVGDLARRRRSAGARRPSPARRGCSPTGT